MANEQINVPSLVVILVLSGLIIRYLFFSSPAQTQPQNRRDSVSAALAREAAAERIQQMFPQVDRRTALWDLQMNGGNIAATTERILSGRMETVSCRMPPPSDGHCPRSSLLLNFGAQSLTDAIITSIATCHLPTASSSDN
jgi:coupling of ubiquitin conjugation to ER degradation protein 1